MSDPDLVALGERLLEVVGDRADAAVSVSRTRQGLTRFANSFIHQNVVDENTTVVLTVSVSGRPAGAASCRTDDKALHELAERALEAASLCPVDPEWPGLAPPEALGVAEDAHFDPVTAAAGPAERGEQVAAFVAAGEGLKAAGSCASRHTDTFFANSAGQRVGGRGTAAFLDGIQRHGASDAVAATCSTRLGDVDGGALGAAAAERARLGADPIELPAGTYEVVLEPRCVADILDFYSVYAFNGRATNEKRSFVQVGEAQFEPSLSIWDDGTDPRHLGPAYDYEGTPKRRLPLVVGGRTTAVCHDRRTAAKAGGGVASTGHAPPEGSSWGPMATNLFLAAAGDQAQARADLIGAVERGLLVSDFWYTRVLDPKTLVVTGLTRNGVFLIENGRVGRPVKNLRFTQSYASALAPGHVLGIGADASLQGDRYGAGGIHAPSLHLAEWHFSGDASN